MATDDFFRARLEQMIDLRHPLAVLAARLPWSAIEAALAPKLAHQARPAKRSLAEDLLGAHERRHQQRRAPAPAGAPDGQPAVPEAQLQLERRGTRRTLGRERAVGAPAKPARSRWCKSTAMKE